MSTDIDALLLSLPEPRPLTSVMAFRDALLITAAGFEDRALEVTKRCVTVVDRILAITYEPANENNQEEPLRNILATFDGISQWVVYDRYNPEQFTARLVEYDHLFPTGSTVIVDVSGMSKFLMAVLLQYLATKDIRLSLVYTEANEYYPTEQQYRDLTSAESTPIFLTTDVYDIVTTGILSSTAMHGYPLVLVAYPSFNTRELIALINELNPQRVVSLLGVPPASENQWRRDAIEHLNRGISNYIEVDKYSISTFNYKETISMLESLYYQYRDSHKIVLAPTGSKCQTIGLWISKLLHPDLQVVYPVTKRHLTEYTVGSGTTWIFDFGEIPELNIAFKSYRQNPIIELERLLEQRREQDQRE